MLQCFRLCAPSAIQHSFDLYSLKWRNPLWLSSNSHFFFSYIESCLPEQECVFIGEWKLLKRHREVLARPKMHIFSIQVLWNTTKVTVKEIHFSIHTTRSMSVFFSLLKSKVHWVLATLNLTYAVCSKQKKRWAMTFPNKRALKYNKKLLFIPIIWLTEFNLCIPEQMTKFTLKDSFKVIMLPPI